MKRTGIPAVLALEDGTVFRGESFGATGERGGEVVFNTSLTGYQEILTDPSYKGQIVTMTPPMIGNYGINEQDGEAERAWVEGFVVREVSRIPSNFRSTEDLHDYLARSDVVGIQGVDTRKLTKRLREEGALRGVLSTEETDGDTLVDRARALPSMEGQDLVKDVTRRREGTWTHAVSDAEFLPEHGEVDGPVFDLVVVDFGVKRNILRNLCGLGFRLRVVPADTSLEEVLSSKPQAVFLSNGPGDPAAVTYGIDLVRGLLEKDLPVFGICLGHQILALALGGTTFKLPFGHHGGNHPVQDLETGKVEVTAQNHGFAVAPELFERDDLVWTHKNLNDGTVAGLRHAERPLMCVQYHPEAAPGPHDSLYLFRRFRDMVVGHYAG
jgi:carbamoyl-phosphate synthase small subunit